MQPYFLSAAILAVVIGLVHSILGERLIFNRLRDGSQLVPTKGKPLLRERHIRILWATWHIVTIFGWGIAAMLFSFAWPASQTTPEVIVTYAIGASMLASSLLVLYATKGKHPGWIGLLIVALLCWLA